MKDTKTYPLLEWARELQMHAQCSLAYTQNPFDRERFERIREIAAEMMAAQIDEPIERVKDIFCHDSGYQTPKMDTRAAIFQDDKILLVEEKDGSWSLPGGWVDSTESVRSNTEKEVWEEAGLRVTATRLIAVLDRKKHNLPVYMFNVCKFFVLCDYISGSFQPNTETTASGYFGLDELPETLSIPKNNYDQIEMCFRAYKDPHWITVFD